MPYLDYKFRSILRDGRTTVVTVAFYAGEDAQEIDPLTGESVTVYRRSGRLQQREVTFRGTVSDADLVKLFNERLATLADQDGVRTPIAEQVVKEASTVQPIGERAI